MEATSSASLIEIIPETKPRPKPLDRVNGAVDNKVSLKGVKQLTDREKVSQILSSLENVRLSLTDNSRQGFLFNASASIRLYLQES